MTVEEEIEELQSDYIICQCYEVSFGDIMEAIENGCKSVEEIMQQTHAGYGCERCLSRRDDANGDRDIHITEILEYSKSKI